MFNLCTTGTRVLPGFTETRGLALFSRLKPSHTHLSRHPRWKETSYSTSSTNSLTLPTTAHFLGSTQTQGLKLSFGRAFAVISTVAGHLPTCTTITTHTGYPRCLPYNAGGLTRYVQLPILARPCKPDVVVDRETGLILPRLPPLMNISSMRD